MALQLLGGQKRNDTALMFVQLIRKLQQRWQQQKQCYRVTSAHLTAKHVTDMDTRGCLAALSLPPPCRMFMPGHPQEHRQEVSRDVHRDG